MIIPAITYNPYERMGTVVEFDAVARSITWSIPDNTGPGFILVQMKFDEEWPDHPKVGETHALIVTDPARKN